MCCKVCPLKGSWLFCICDRPDTDQDRGKSVWMGKEPDVSYNLCTARWQSLHHHRTMTGVHSEYGDISSLNRYESKSRCKAWEQKKTRGAQKRATTDWGNGANAVFLVSPHWRNPASVFSLSLNQSPVLLVWEPSLHPDVNQINSTCFTQR